MKQNKKLTGSVVTKKHIDYLININEIPSWVMGSYTEITERLSDSGLSCLELSFYSDNDNREWKQYALYESGSDIPASCPLKIEKI
ncbi:YqcI/YcgG family protein [Salmonella enterica]|nr:hypothetical protein [Salmonella enterica]EBI0041260.1 hypothetical protein [Salmonella enterica subsp. diarizonae serovar 61:k:z35]EBW3154375.1 hypothetical protein [Salmonella enterica subsp. enterica serovar Java]ECD9254258.1 YqcI/YcgG family protein [Salmonella enterica subsp. diarizonae]ECT8549879.1 hypothetical protein [Salmonella enterica subsp. diarizonae serovar 48:i:z]EIC4422399.1 YqcI/YcgG family protein [Salmonella enterica subsp. enterica serovar Cerro]